MSRLIRPYGSKTAPPTTSTVITTETVTETVRVCEQQPVIDTQTYIAGGDDETVIGESIVLQGPLSDLELTSFLDSQPNGTVVIVVTDTGETTEVCHEETITKDVTRETEVTTPGATLPVFDQGWDGGADSFTRLIGNGGFQFQILASSLGVFCGLNGQPMNTDPYEIEYAFYGSRGRYTTYPGGVAASFTDSTVFLIQRIGNKVTWLVDGERVHSQEFTEIPEDLWADASLYASDDEIFDPSFTGVVFIEGVGEGYFPVLTTQGRVVQRGTAAGVLPQLTTKGQSWIAGSANGELSRFSTTGSSWIWGVADSALPPLNSLGVELNADGYGLVLLPALISQGIAGLWGAAHGLLPAMTSSGMTSLWGRGEASLPQMSGDGRAAHGGNGDAQLPVLTGRGRAARGGSAEAVLPRLITFGKSGKNGYGFVDLPALRSRANNLPVPVINYGLNSLPPLFTRSHGVIRFNLTGTGESTLPTIRSIAIGRMDSFLSGYGFTILQKLLSRGSESASGINVGVIPALLSKGFASGQGVNFSVLPRLQSHGFGDVGRANLYGFGAVRLPTFNTWGRQMTNSGFVALSSPFVSSHGGLNHWYGYCFNDPIREQLVSGLQGTWLKRSEDRIETYFGLLGSNTRDLQVTYDYDAVSGDAAFVATYYVNNIPQRFELHLDLLDFVPPDLMSSGIRMDRILAHELTHAVLNDRINTLSWPNWFNEGLCEFIHGASERVKTDLARLGTANLLVSLNDNVSGHAAMSSKHYSAGYLAVWKLHSVISGGIATLLASLESGTDLNTAIANLTPFTSVANFIGWMTGANGIAFVNELVNRQLFDNADTGAIGGFDVDGGAILDDSTVIADD